MLLVLLRYIMYRDFTGSRDERPFGPGISGHAKLLKTRNTKDLYLQTSQQIKTYYNDLKTSN